ncbi:serpin B4-like [Rhinophrynus dorsalis]
MESISESINEFCISLYQEVSATKKDDNIFLSPLGISASLSLLHMGAKGHTASQIEKVLHFSELKEAGNPQTSCEPEPKHVRHHEQRGHRQKAPLCDQVAGVHSKFQALLSQLTKPTNNAELKIANGMFTQKNFPFLDQYIRCAQTLYKTKLDSVDFQKDETRKEINTWVESQTQGKIKDLFPKDSLDDKTVLVLANAMYFKGQWSSQFKTENTKQSPFHVNKDVVKPVPMMNQTEKFNLGVINEVNAHILELPYGDRGLSMFILLSDEMFGVEKIQQKLSAESLAMWMKNLKMTKVELSMPRFRLEDNYSLGQYLINMGMVDAFSQGKANLSGMSDVGLYVTHVVHKAFADVNEEGTEAASATGVAIAPKMLEIPHKYILNHPFLFFILHNATNTILFFGKYCSP